MRTHDHRSLFSACAPQGSCINGQIVASWASPGGGPWLRRLTPAVLLALTLLVWPGMFTYAANQSEVTFSVVDEVGSPAAGLEVVLTAIDKAESPLGTAPWTAKTNKKGRAVFPFLPYNAQGGGLYAISVNKDGYFVRQYKIESRQVQSQQDQGRGTLIQNDEGKASPKQKLPALMVKPGGHASIDLTIAPVGSAASAGPPPSAGGDKAVEGGAAAAPAPKAEAPPADPVTKARILMSEGKYAEAEESLKVLEQSKPSAEVDYELARVYHLQDKDAEQKTALKAALAKDTTFPKAHYELGKMLYEEGRTVEAISEFQAELKAHADDSATQMGLAALYIEAGRPADALNLYEAMVAANPANTDALVSLDGLYTTQGDLKKSEEVYKKILALNPTGADQVYYRAGLNISKRQDLSDADRSRAAAAFSKAVELNPKLATAHRELGYTLVGMGKLDGAKAHFKAYLDLEPGAKDAPTIRQFLQGD